MPPVNIQNGLLVLLESALPAPLASLFLLSKESLNFCRRHRPQFQPRHFAGWHRFQPRRRSQSHLFSALLQVDSSGQKTDSNESEIYSSYSSHHQETYLQTLDGLDVKRLGAPLPRRRAALLLRLQLFGGWRRHVVLVAFLDINDSINISYRKSYSFLRLPWVK